MYSIKRQVKSTLTLKNITRNGNKFENEDGEAIDIPDLLGKAFGDNSFTLTVTLQENEEFPIPEEFPDITEDEEMFNG